MSRQKQVLGNLPASALNVSSSLAALLVHTVDENGVFTSPAGGGSTQVSIREILSSSGGSLIDSTNVSLGVTIREGGGAGVQYTDGDTDASVTGTALIFENSSNTLRPVTIARGLPVNLVSGQSTITTVSTGSVRVHQSTAADLNVTVANLSTTVNVSSLAGAVIVRSSAADFAATVTPASGSTWAVRPLQSSAADLQVTATPAAGSTWSVRPLQSSQADLRVTVYQSTGADLNVNQSNFSTTVNASSVAGRVLVDQNSTVWSVQQRVLGAATDNVAAVVCDNLLQAAQTSTRAVGTNSTMRGLAVRSICPDSTFASGQAGTAGDNTIISSAATGIYVYAYSISQTAVALNRCRFLNGSTAECWRVVLQSQSSAASSGVSVMADHSELAVSPPAYLFRTAAGNALLMHTISSGVTYSVSAWRE